MSVVPIRKEHRSLQPDYIVPMFIAYKRAQGLAPRTMKDYGKTLGLLFRLHPDALDAPREATLAFLSRYAAPNSYNTRFAVLSVFWRWMMEEGFIRGDGYPLRGLKKRKPQHRIVQLSEKDIGRLLKQPDRTTYCGLRDYALILLQIDTGARPSEALTLAPGDYNREEGSITIRAEHAKTRVARTLPLSGATMDAMDRLLAVRPREWSESPLFCSDDGTPFQVTSWTRRIVDYGAAVGLHVTAYHLRHVAALMLLRRGASAFTVQRVLGHSSLSTTRIYLALNDEDTKREHAAAGVVPFILGTEAPPPPRKRLRKIQGA